MEEEEQNDRNAAAAEMRATWAGRSLLEELHLAEMRAIISAPLDAKTTTRKALAAEIGVTVYQLGNFLDGGTLREGDLNSVAKWCEDKPTPHVPPYVVAIGVLCHWFPPGMVGSARETLWAQVRRLYASKNIEIPRYAIVETDALLLRPSDRGHGRDPVVI